MTRRALSGRPSVVGWVLTPPVPDAWVFDDEGDAAAPAAAAAAGGAGYGAIATPPTAAP